MTGDPLFLVAVNIFVAVLVRMLKPNVATAVLLAIVMIGSAGFLGTEYGSELLSAAYQGRDAALTLMGKPPGWPPEKYRTYPDLALVDQNGQATRLSDFRGKVILVEPVGLSCRACVAFAGGHKQGPFQGVPPQSNLRSIEHYAKQFAGVQLDDERLVYIQLLLFNQQMEAPTLAETAAWAEHFGMDRSENFIVLAGTENMASRASRDLIPGFHLIDKNLVLRANSSGHQPEDDLYAELLPKIRRLLKEGGRSDGQ